MRRLPYSAVMTTPGSPFGARLRQSRRQAGLSQLALAGRIGSTGRHISFLETGRSRPSRGMVLRLAGTLGLGMGDTNELLHAAGLPAAWVDATPPGTGYGAYLAAVDRLLAAHEPYPATVLDRHWTVVAVNPAARALFGPAVAGSNFVRDTLARPEAAALVANWAEVAWAGLDRLRHQHRRAPLDPELGALVGIAEAALADVPRPDAGDPDLLVCPALRVDGQIIRTVVMVARFEHAADALAGLRVELMYPMDAAAERFFRAGPRNS
jgi:transcriptional regulator with XRE-family HTH domain